VLSRLKNTSDYTYLIKSEYLFKKSDLEQVEGKLSEAEHVHPHVHLGDEVQKEVVCGQGVTEQEPCQVVVEFGPSRSLKRILLFLINSINRSLKKNFIIFSKLLFNE